jgi:hypothetical protein
MGLFGGGGDVEVAPPEPWEGQSPFLKFGFNEAERLYKLFQGSPAYQGSLYAPSNPLQQGGAWQLANFAAGPGGQMTGAATDASLAALGAGAGFGGNAQSIYGRAQMDPTQGIISNAGSMASNPYMDGMIDAASRDVSRNLFENEIPGLNQEAVGSGNTNSSRAGTVEGIMRRGAADRVADISASLRGGAYQNGLGLASNNWSSGLGHQLGANSQVGNAFTSGLTGAQGAQSMGFGNAGAISNAGAFFQDDEQKMLDAAYQKWNMNDMRPADLLSRYWGVASTGWNGGGGSATSGGGGGGFGSLLSGAGGLLTGLAAFCWVAREVYGERNPKWLLFRNWMLTKAPKWFVRLYVKHGPAFAQYIADKPLLKRIIRKLMDQVIRGEVRNVQSGHSFARS